MKTSAPMDLDIFGDIKVQLQTNQNWACFVRNPKIVNTYWQNNMINLKQTVWETTKWH